MRTLYKMGSLLFPSFQPFSKSFLSFPIKIYSFHPNSISTSPALFSLPRSRLSFCCSTKGPVDGRDRGMDGRVGSGAALTAVHGEIHVIVGPMFAGKSTALLRRMQAETDNGRKVAVIKSGKDNRYAVDSVVTHDGTQMPCFALAQLSVFQSKLGAEAYEKLDVIGIDEAQFFDDLYDFCCKAADHDGKIVIVAGLDGDYLRRSFGSVLDIIPLADSVTKLTARCELCGKRAFFTLRKTNDKQTELIGGADIYMPVCRKHYVNGQYVMEAARVVLESRKVHDEPLMEALPLTEPTPLAA